MKKNIQPKKILLSLGLVATLCLSFAIKALADITYGPESITNDGGNLILQPSGGNVGIGTTTPGFLFTVAGDQLTSGNLTFGKGSVIASEINTTTSGFNTLLQNIYINKSLNNIGVLNPPSFVQSALNVVVQDNTGNAQNAGLFGNVCTAGEGVTCPLANGVEGDSYFAGTGGTSSEMTGVNGYVRVETGASGLVPFMASFRSAGSGVRAATVTTMADYYGSGLVVSGTGHVINGYGARFGAPTTVDTGELDNSYGLYVNNDGNGTNIKRNAYFGSGIVEVQDRLMVSGTVMPGLKISGAYTAPDPSHPAFLFNPSITSTGNADTYSVDFNPSITTPSSSSVTSINGTRFDIPTITLGSGGTLTNAMTAYIAGAPSVGTNKYALYVDGSTARTHIAGNLTVAGQYNSTGGDARFGGTVTLPNNTFLQGRNAANTGNINIIQVNASDELTVSKNLNITGGATLYPAEIRASGNYRCTNDGNCNVGQSGSVGRPNVAYIKTKLNIGGSDGVTVSGTTCTITGITGGIITAATCTP